MAHDSTGKALPEAVHRQLGRLFESPHFRASKRSRDCLQYIVDRALDGSTDRLKERSIGVDVFGRDPDYDTGADSVVRVTVNELRKKLAQYYVHAGPDEEIIVELPAGSYVPQFTWAHAAPEPTSEARQQPGTGRRHMLLVAVLGLVIVLAVAGILVLPRAGDSTLAEFWSPVLRNPRPVLICIGNPVVYLIAKRRDPALGLPNIPPPVEGPASSHQLVPVTDQFFGAGDALAGMSLVATLTKLGKAFEVRPGVDVSYGDLRSYPVIFIGFSNKLHLQMTKALRFALRLEDGRPPMIYDHLNPEKSWSLPGVADNGKTETDYLLISRVFNSETGQPLVEAAGITNYGSRAAGEFLTNAAYLRQAVALMPSDWTKKNIQIVCKIRVVGNGPTAPTVIGVHTW